MVCSRVDEMIRLVESVEGQNHIYQVKRPKNLFSIFNDYTCSKTFYVNLECWNCYVGSSWWHCKKIFGFFCVPDFMGKCAERRKRKCFRNNQNESKFVQNYRSV